MPDGRLTWHAGSVLPYASLWHTVLRACALNALHPRDLPPRMARPLATVELLENHGDVDVTAFAHALGESPAAFRWSTLGGLPAWLDRALVVPQPRLCLACLAAGYHAALFSVALLDACPIHGMPLVDRCHCGAPFRATLRSLTDYGTAGSCQCGRLHFFTRDTCRRPRLTPAMTRSLDPVAAWLDAMSSLIRPARLEEALCQPAPDSVAWLAAAADTLGLPYPACFRTMRPIHVAAVWYGTPFPVVSSHHPQPQQAVARNDGPTSYWPTTPATTVYRALARHVRRHLAPGSTRWVAGFIDACDPLMIAEQVGGSRRARQAFVDLLWGRDRVPHRAAALARSAAAGGNGGALRRDAGGRLPGSRRGRCRCRGPALARLPCRAREPRCRLARRASACDGRRAIRCGRLVGHRAEHVVARQWVACARDARRAGFRGPKPDVLGGRKPRRQGDAPGGRCGPPAGASRHDVGGQSGRVPELVRRRWMARDRRDRPGRRRSAAAQTVGAAGWTAMVLALSGRRRPFCGARGRCPAAGAGRHARRGDRGAPAWCDGLLAGLSGCAAIPSFGTHRYA